MTVQQLMRYEPQTGEESEIDNEIEAIPFKPGEPKFGGIGSI